MRSGTSRSCSGVSNDPVARERTTGASGRTVDGPDPGWSDKRLVQACLDGSEQAWSALIDKYKRLIYSIAVRYGASPEDAADIFQSVCLELFSQLSHLRKTAALPGWLITVTAHQSFHWKRRHLKRQDRERTNLEVEELDAHLPVPADVTEEAEREQMVRDATARLSPRCQEMIRLLFYTEPPLPYRDVARRLGLATGSIGFIRGRCLQRLQKTLHAMGF
jgi:RNA polymerase sigma factor (sigma-70 family)